ncbi:hypothetical protein [Paraburkholderia sp.]|jgi:Cu/Ag efflux protein CusF|uniref:hypothetical protein n=1 Tax=Paraburkholderia sp. TaxID=1926495 RepID=UPI002F402FD3
MNKRTLSIVASVLIAAAPLASSAADVAPASFEGSSVLQAEGTVKNVDQAKHVVTVLDQHGGEAAFTVTETGNLAQIKPGARVHVRMIRNALVSPSQGALGQSSPLDVIAEVQAVDHAAGVIELKGPNGAVFHVQGRDPAKLAGLQPGTHLKVAYTPQVSVAVAPAQ